MIRIQEILLSIYLLLAVVVTFILSLPVLCISYLITDQKTFARINEIIGVKILLGFMTVPGYWNIKITDLRREKTFNDQYVIVANHSSFIDTLLVWQLPIYKKFMMAEKFIQIPLFGRVCRGCGHVFVDRHDKSTTDGAVNRAAEAMKDGSSFVIYPEGRRSENPYKLLDFKTGAFRVAQKTGAKILPVAIKGAGEALPVGGPCRSANIELIIGEPIQVGPEWEDINKSIDQVKVFLLGNIKDE